MGTPLTNVRYPRSKAKETSCNDHSSWPFYLLFFGLSVNQFNQSIIATFGLQGGSVSPEFFLGGIFLFIALCCTAGDITWDKSFKIALVLIIFCAFWANVGNMCHGGNLRNYFTFPAFVLYFLVGYAFTVKYFDQFVNRLPLGLVLICTCWIIFFYLNYRNGNITFLFAGGTNRIYWKGYFAATEIPIFLGIQFCYLLYSFFSCKRRFLQLFSMILLSVNLYIMLRCGARSALLAYFAVLTGYILFGGRISKIVTEKYFSIFFIISCVALVSVFSSNIANDLVKGTISRISGSDNTGYGRRTMLYSATWKVACANPFIGVGNDDWRNFGFYAGIKYTSGLSKQTPPHQNILGIAALFGFPTAIAYLAFVFFTFYIGGKQLLAQRSISGYGNAIGLLLLAFMCIFYQQFRGLIQDTWRYKELYLWSGVLFACVRQLKETANGMPRESDNG